MEPSLSPFNSSRRIHASTRFVPAYNHAPGNRSRIQRHEIGNPDAQSDFGNTPSALAIHHIHYYAKEIDRCILVTHQMTAKDYMARLPEMAENVTIVHKDTLGAFTEPAHNRMDARKDHYEETALDHFGIPDDAFVLRVDLDEFHVYPEPVRALVSRMIEKNIPAVLGYFRDQLKLTADQTQVVLAKIDEHTDLASQFPMCATYARDMVRPAPCEEKIMIARKSVKLGYGRHHIRKASGEKDEGATRAAMCWGELKQGWGGDHFYVHHFRWTERLVGLIQRDLDPADYGQIYIREVNGLKRLFQEPNFLAFKRQQVRCLYPFEALPKTGMCRD